MTDHSKRTELEMLAHVLANASVLDQYEITADFFADQEYGNLFLAMADIHERSDQQNRINIQVALKNLQLTVETETIDLLFNTTKSSSLKLTYETLLNLWRSREGKKTLNTMSSELEMAKPEEVSEILAEGTERLDIIAQNEVIEGSSMSDLVKLFSEEAGNTKILIEGLKTGFPTIDSSFNGYKEGQIGIISAGTGIGKTTFALNMAYNMAIAGNSVGFLSLEMTKDELLNRIIGLHAECAVHSIERRDVDPEVVEKAKGLEGLPLRIYELYGRTVDNIIATLTAIKRKAKAAIIFIDYIGLIHHPNSKSLHESYANIIAKIKTAAQKLRIPIICLAQVNRESREKGYTADSIQYSAAISNTAHQITILKNTDEYDEQLTERKIEAKIVKNRGGRSFIDIPMTFNYATQKITELLTEDHLAEGFA